MFKNYLDYKTSRNNSFVYHNVRGAFERIETPLFVLICLILIITSKVNHKITDTFSMAILESAMPVANAVSAPLNAVANIVVNFNDLIDAKNRNTHLLKENEQLKALYIKSLNINQENTQIKEALKYVSLKSTQFTVAHLIGHTYRTYSNNVFISAGIDQGVKKDDVVTGNNTLIGRVVQLNADKSRVLLVTDINSHIPVIVSGAKTRGILAGNNSNMMEILYLDKNHKITIGELVFSSSDGDAIPPGLLVGVVVKVDDGYAGVKMIEDVKNLDMVSVSSY